MISDELYARFLAKIEVDPTGNCWIWTASTQGGYGQIKVPGTRRQIRAHRLSYLRNVGAIPKGMMVLHRCDNRRCCNPDHLFLGKAADNAADMAEKGRHLFGERNAQHKLTEAKVHKIFDLSEAGRSQHEIAAIFDVGQMTVCRILNGLRWRHVYLKRQAK